MKKFILFLFASVLGIVFCFATTEHVKFEKDHGIAFVICMPEIKVSVDTLNLRFGRQYNEDCIHEKLISCKKIKPGYSVTYGNYRYGSLFNNCELAYSYRRLV